MATERVGVYRKYYGPIPKDKSGRPLPKSEWPKKRPHSWAVRWFGSDGKRYSRSFKSRREADQFGESTQAAMRVGKGDEPQSVTLSKFAEMYLDLRGDLAPSTKTEYERTLRLLREFLGHDQIVSKVSSLDARRFLTWFRGRKHRGRNPAPATVNKVLRDPQRNLHRLPTMSDKIPDKISKIALVSPCQDGVCEGCSGVPGAICTT